MSELKKFEQILDNQHVNYFTRETLNSLKNEYEKVLGEISQLQTKLAESEAMVAEISKCCEIAKNTAGWDDININLHFALDDLFHAISLRQQQTNGE